MDLIRSTLVKYTRVTTEFLNCQYLRVLMLIRMQEV